MARCARLFNERLGYDPDAETAGDEASERAASFALLLNIASDLVWVNETAGAPEFLAELDRRDEAETAAHGVGVNLLTYHRAKGLEWDAVFLPAVEEGMLPIRQAKTDEQVAEERRLLYVGITRARTHLALSWSKKPSRFIDVIRVQTVRTIPPRGWHRPTDGGRNQPAARVAAAVAPRTGEEGQRPCLHRGARRDARRHRRGPPDVDVAAPPIKGIGPAKLDEYGAEILAIVASAPRGSGFRVR